jgi:glycerol-3-phosphate acyltransferase PlsY
METPEVIASNHRKPVKSDDSPAIWRRLFHLTFGSIVPVAGIFASWPVMVAAAGSLALGGLALDLTRFRSGALNRLFLRWLAPLLKAGEDYRLTGATYMLLAAFFAFLLFDQAVAVTALLFLSIGDPVAALLGGRTAGPKILGKSPLGTVAFIGVSLLVVTVLISSGFIQFHWGLLAGAIVAGLMELAPIPLDDNLTIPLLSGAVMHFLIT